MTTVESPTEALKPHAVSPLTRRILQLNLLAQTAIVITGGLVRLTASGLGCPTWPECVPGSYTPVPYQEQQWHKYVEFGNRMLTFALVIIAVATFIAIWRQSPRRSSLVWLASVPFLGTVAQAVLGGITVVTGLNPWTVAAHLLVSMALIGAATVLLYRANEPGDTPKHVRVPRVIRILAGAIVVNAALVISLGTVVTGSGPHSGDAAAQTRNGFDPRSVAWLHADLVLLFLGLTLGILVALIAISAPRDIRNAALWVIGVSIAQGSLGYVQYFSGVPWGEVLVHQLGACLTWITVIWLWLTTRSRGQSAT